MTSRNSRSIRGRPGSLKKSVQYSTALNGDVTGLLTNKKSEDFDIKILQQKEHEAEVKRCV